MRILIIPDVHGRDFWKEPCSHIDDFDKVIFLGDYHDPYPNQVTKEQSFNNFKNDLVPFILEHSDKVICLLGNHDLPYLIGGECCRHDLDNEAEIGKLMYKLNIQITFQVDNYLFSHSGVLPQWLIKNKLFYDELNKLDFNDYTLRQVSAYRGGWGIGSCIWGDVREYDNNQKIPNIYQIFGHTQLHTAYITDTFACLDCREAFILDTTKQELKKYEKTI